MNPVRSRVNLSAFDQALQEPVEALARALRRLDPSQGRIARRGARSAVSDALRRLRQAVEDGYPVERRPPARRRGIRLRRALLTEIALRDHEGGAT